MPVVGLNPEIMETQWGNVVIRKTTVNEKRMSNIGYGGPLDRKVFN